MTQKRHNDLFISTLHELHNEAPRELLHSLREHLHAVRQSNPNSAQTAEACLAGLTSDASTLLHVLTAAYLINGGVMLKHTYDEKEENELSLTELEEELNSFGLTEDLLQEFHARTPPPPSHTGSATPPPPEPAPPS